MTNNAKKLIAISCAAVMLTSTLGACTAAGGGSSAGSTSVSSSCEAWHTDGKTVVFTLRDISAGTGYTWKYEISNEEVLKGTGSEVENSNNRDGIVGASGLIRFSFEGVAEGSTALIFTQTSPSGNEDGDRLRYEIAVADDGTVTVG